MTTDNKSLFDAIDADKNGFITVSELSSAFKLTESNARDILKAKDINNDNQISFEEVGIHQPFEPPQSLISNSFACGWTGKMQLRQVSSSNTVNSSNRWTKTVMAPCPFKSSAKQ